MSKCFKIIIFLTVGLGWFVLPAPGQEPAGNPIRLSGLVFDIDSLSPLPGTHYYKINKGTGGITNGEGRFQTSVQVNDSIVFSFVGYKNHLFIVADTMLPGDYVIGIPLSRDTTMIGEVMIMPRIKNLKQDFLSTPHRGSDKALNNAQQNLQVATAQGIAGKGIPFDSDMSYKMQKQKFEMQAMNRGMIAPDRMVGLNFLMVVPYLIYKLSEGNTEPTPPNIFISDKEIQEIYNRYRNTFYAPQKSPDSK